MAKKERKPTNRIKRRYGVDQKKMMTITVTEAVIAAVVAFTVLYLIYPYVKLSLPRLVYSLGVAVLLFVAIMMNSMPKKAREVIVREKSIEVVEYDPRDKTPSNRGRKITRQHEILKVDSYQVGLLKITVKGIFYEYNAPIKIDRFFVDEKEIIKELERFKDVEVELEEDE